MKLAKLFSFFQRRKKLENRLAEIETRQTVLFSHAILQNQVNTHQDNINKASLKSSTLTLIALVLLLGLVAYLFFNKPKSAFYVD